MKNDCSTQYINTENDSNAKELPELYESKVNCCGCSGCYAACPVHAIHMQPDSEGYLYPVVDASLCIRCYKCLSVCSFKKAQKRKKFL